jgi:uncharacterized protein (TIGR03382 family)
VGCQDSLTLHFGLGKRDRVETVTVHWPGLDPQTFGPFAADQTLQIVEGQGASGLAPIEPTDAASNDANGGDDVLSDTGPAEPAARAGGCSATPHAAQNAAGRAGWLVLLAAIVLTRRKRLLATSDTPA